jgi:hypothetical protein
MKPLIDELFCWQSGRMLQVLTDLGISHSYVLYLLSFPIIQVGAPLVIPMNHHINSGDDNEDRKRLKEKLKVWFVSNSQAMNVTA